MGSDDLKFMTSNWCYQNVQESLSLSHYEYKHDFYLLNSCQQKIRRNYAKNQHQLVFFKAITAYQFNSL